MLTLPHTLIAAALVKIFPYPLLVLPLALASHFLVDFLIPHWNPHLYSEFKKNGQISRQSWYVIIVDSLLALIFCFYILLKYWPSVLLIALYAGAIFLAVLPDLIEIPYYFFNYKARWLKKYIDFQHKHQSNGIFLTGIITQLLIIIFCLVVFLI